MMVIRNKRVPRFATLPHSVELGIRKLGHNLKTARLRRNLTIEDVAEKIGVSRFVVADAEHGKASTGIAVYAALLWTYRLLDQLTQIGSPEQDKEGIAMTLTRQRARAPRANGLSNDF
jgi:transcriptional regulator with XRE-family HTH domain